MGPSLLFALFLRAFASLPEPFPIFSFPFFPSISLHLPRSLSLSAVYHYLFQSTLTGAPPPTPVQPSAAAQLHPLHATALPIHWPEHPPIPCGTRLGFIQGGGGAWGWLETRRGGRPKTVSAVAREWNSPLRDFLSFKRGFCRVTWRGKGMRGYGYAAGDEDLEFRKSGVRPRGFNQVRAPGGKRESHYH